MKLIEPKPPGIENRQEFYAQGNLIVKNNITAAFSWTEQDFIGAHRAARLARDPGYDSLITRAGFLLFGHLFFVSGLLVLPAVFMRKKGDNAPIPLGAVFMMAGISLIAGFVLFTNWYGYRWLMRRAFRKSLLGGDLKSSYIFTPEYIQSENRLIEAKKKWEVVDRVIELRDGFVLVIGGAAEWVPKHAFAEPFDDVEFANLAKSRVKKYQIVDRRAMLAR